MSVKSRFRTLLLPLILIAQPGVTWTFSPVALRSRKANRITPLFGWGPDPVWGAAKVEYSVPSPFHDECVHLRVSVPPGVEDAAKFEIPGQYVQVKIAGDDECKPSFIAVANSIQSVEEEGCYEFLIKKTENNSWCTDTKEGDLLDVSQILGGGFPVAENFDGFKFDFPTQNILMFASGTGIAPIRSVIESGVLKPDSGRSCRLYYGCRSPSEMAYAERFAEWEAAGVQVVPVVSQPEGTGWNGRTGYIQNALEEDGVVAPKNCGAIMCGMKGMADSVKDVLGKAGVIEGRVLTNF